MRNRMTLWMVVLAAAACLAAPVAQAGLLGHWTFDDSGNLGLDSAIGNVLSVAGDAHYIAGGATGGALALDGSGDYLGGAHPLPRGDSPYTISAWIQPTATGTRGIVGWGNYGAARQVNAFRLMGDNGFRHYWWAADLDRDAAAAGVDLDDGSWHHVLATHNGSTRALYVDGQPIGSDSPGAHNAGGGNFRIGSTNFGEFFAGAIDEVAIWNSGVTPNQVRALAAGAAPAALPAPDTLVAHWVADDYAGGNWVDRIGGIQAVVEDNPSAVGGALNGHAVVSFDGNDAFRVAAPDNPLGNAGDFTLATVLRTSTPGVGNPTDGWWTNTGIVDMEMPGWVQDWGLVINSQASIGAGLGGYWPNQITLPSAQTGLDNGEAHVAIYTRQGGTVTLTVDGVPVSQTNNGGGMTLERLVNQFTIGRRQTGGNFYTGDLAELRIHEAQLTAAQTQALTMDLARTYGFSNVTHWTNPGTGSWDTGGNWDNGIPTPLSDAFVENGGTAQLVGGTAAAGSLTIGETGAGTLEWTGGDLACWDIAVGPGGVIDRSGYPSDWAYGGQLQVNGGTVMMNAGEELQLNDGATMSLTDGAFVSNFHAVIVGNAGSTDTMQTVAVADTAQMTGLNYIVIGKSGHKGQVLQSGGAVGTTHLFLGEYTGSEGHYVLSEGAVNVGADLLVGKESVGTFTQAGGSVTAGGGDSMIIAVWPGSLGSYTMTDGSLSLGGNFQIGARDQGLFDQSGGASSWGGWLAVGRYDGGDGIMRLHGDAVCQGANAIIAEAAGTTGLLQVADAAQFSVSNSLEVGRYGIGTVEQTGGAVTVGDTIYVRPASAYRQSGGTVDTGRTLMWGTAAEPGEMELSGDAVYHNARYFSAGTRNGDVSILRVRDSAQLLVDGDFNVSDQAGSMGTLYLDGGLVRGNIVFIGKSGGTVGTVHQTDGELRSNNYLCIGTAPGSTGEYHLDGGTLWANSDLNVSDQTNSTGTLYLDGGIARGNIVYIGKSADTTGTVYQTGGQLVSNASLRMGYGNNSLGTLEMSGTAQVNVGSYLCIGTANGSTGIARMSDSAQLLATTDFNVSDQAGSTGTLFLDGGLARGNTVYIGKSANTLGTVVQNGGQMVADGNLYIAWDGASTGDYTLNDGEIVVNGGVMRVGNQGTATLTQTGGSIRTANWFVVGQGGNKTSTYNMSGGTLDVNTNGGGERLQVGVWDTVHGQFNLSGTAQVVVHSSETQIGGDHATATGTMTIADAAQLHTPMLRVGRPGQGQLTQTGGLVVTTVNPQIGAYGPGTLDQTGGLFYHVRHMAVGRYSGSSGTYNAGGAGINAGRWIIVAEDGGTDGLMTVSDSAIVSLGGSSVSPASLEVARNGVGTVTQTGGTVYADTVMIASGGGGTGVYQLQGGLLQSRELTYGPGSAAFTFTGGTLQPGTVGFGLHNQGGTLDVATPPTAGFHVKWYDGNAMTDDPGNWVPPATPHAEQVVDAVEYGGGAPPNGYPGGSSDYYGAVYSAYLYAPQSGNYSFRERVDDSSALYLDGNLILWDYTAGSDLGEPTGNPWTVHAATTVPLAAGWHQLELRWSDHWGGQNAYLEWDPAGGQNWSLLVGGAVFADLGGPIGVSTIQGDYIQDPDGALAIGLNGYGQGTDYDLLWVADNVFLRGTLDVAVLSEFGLAWPDTFDVVEGASITVDGLTVTDPFDWAHFDYQVIDLPTGRQALRLTFIPEPTTLALLGLALPALLRRRRRR